MLFSPVKSVRASEEAAEQIKQAIIEGRLAPGDRLPPERELAEQFGLSRITVREALRILEAKGFLEIRVGAAGGAFVRTPSLEWLGESLTAILKLRRSTFVELAQARKILEVNIAGLAAQNATLEDLEAMEAAIQEAREALEEGHTHYMPYSIAFHTALARAAKNEVLFFIVDSLRSLYYEALEHLPPMQMAYKAVEDHTRILEAVRNRDAELARSLMEEHITYFMERVIEHIAQQDEEETRTQKS